MQKLFSFALLRMVVSAFADEAKVCVSGECGGPSDGSTGSDMTMLQATMPLHDEYYEENYDHDVGDEVVDEHEDEPVETVVWPVQAEGGDEEASGGEDDSRGLCERFFVVNEDAMRMHMDMIVKALPGLVKLKDLVLELVSTVRDALQPVEATLKGSLKNIEASGGKLEEAVNGWVKSLDEEQQRALGGIKDLVPRIFGDVTNSTTSGEQMEQDVNELKDRIIKFYEDQYSPEFREDLRPMFELIAARFDDMKNLFAVAADIIKDFAGFVLAGGGRVNKRVMKDLENIGGRVTSGAVDALSYADQEDPCSRILEEGVNFYDTINSDMNLGKIVKKIHKNAGAIEKQLTMSAKELGDIGQEIEVTAGAILGQFVKIFEKLGVREMLADNPEIETEWRKINTDISSAKDAVEGALAARQKDINKLLGKIVDVLEKIWRQLVKYFKQGGKGKDKKKGKDGGKGKDKKKGKDGGKGQGAKKAKAKGKKEKK